MQLAATPGAAFLVFTLYAWPLVPSKGVTFWKLPSALPRTVSFEKTFWISLIDSFRISSSEEGKRSGRLESSVAWWVVRSTGACTCCQHHYLRKGEEKHSHRFGSEAKDFSLWHVWGPARLDLWEFQKGSRSKLRSSPHSAEIIVLKKWRLDEWKPH